MLELQHYRHTLTHIMMQALERLYGAIPGVGPAIENGFYHDFDAEYKISETDLPKLEEEMRKIIADDLPIVSKVMPIDEAIDFLRNEKKYIYTAELAEELRDQGHTEVSFYGQGDFLNMCRGGHVERTGMIKADAFHLYKVAGAYWRGNEKNKMLQRIYGYAFLTKEKLQEHLTQVEEAKKRDHRKLGREMDLFLFSDLIGSGLPVYTPYGTVILEEIKKYSRELNHKIGYQEVHTPQINRAELFKISGHYEKYKDDMFRANSNYTEDEFFLKPMNCPQHTQIYANKLRSYRDLPIRFSDFANLYRDEKPGELSGLERLRAFSQDDGHAFCREDQIKEEFVRILGVIHEALSIYGLSYRVRLSLWDANNKEKYLGDESVWVRSQTLLRELLDENKIDYVSAEGEAAIYGPKMDVIARDALGRETQLSTIQIDFNIPKRFGLTYVTENGSEETPVMIHRAIVGSRERFLSVYLEHTAGAFPLWMAPIQVKILSVSDSHAEFCKKLSLELESSGIRVSLDDSNETVGKKIRNASVMRVPYLLVIGDREMTEGNFAVRVRGVQAMVSVEKGKFIAAVKEKIASRSSELGF